jgi:hypothetical protein
VAPLCGRLSESKAGMETGGAIYPVTRLRG